MPFDFDSETRRQLGYRLIDRIDEYFSGLAQRPVQPPEDLRTFTDLVASLPEFGDDAGKVLDTLCSEMLAQGFHVPSANYFGLMNPTPTYMAVLAEALVAALNPQLASLARSQLAARIERETVSWIGGRVGWDLGASRRAFPFRNLARSEFDEVIAMLSDGIAARRGRYGAYLHRDQVKDENDDPNPTK